MSETDLLVRLTADARELLAEMRRANAGFAREADRLKAKSKETETALARITAAAGPVKAALAGVLAGASIGGMALLVKNALDAAGGLGELAEQLGTTTGNLQVYQYAATQAGATTEELEVGLSTLSRRIGEAVNGDKAAVDAFRALGVSFADTSGHARSTDDVLRDLADRYQGAGDKAAAAAVLVDLFGKSGRRLLPLIAGGAAGLDDFRQAAEEAGAVMGDELIAKADEAGDKLAAIEWIIKQKTTIALGQLAPQAKAAGEAFQWLVEQLVHVVQGLDLLAAKAGGGTDWAKGAILEKGYSDAVKRLGEAEQTLERMRQSARVSPAFVSPQQIDQQVASIRRLRQEVDSAQAALLGYHEEQNKLSAGKSDEKFTVAASPYQQTNDEAAKSQKVIAGLKAEQAALAMTNRERAVAADLAKLDAAATPEQRAEVERLSAAIWDETAARAELARQAKIQLEQMEADGNGLAEWEEQHNKAVLSYRAASEALDDEVANNRELIAALGMGSEEYEKQGAYLDILNRFKATGIELDDAATERARELADVLGRQRDQIDSLKTAHDEQKRAAADASRVIAQGFEDAIVAGGDLRDVLKALLQDLARIALRLSVTKPLENALTGGDKGGGLLDGLGKGLGSYFGNLFGGGGVDYAASIPQSGMTAATGWGYHNGGVVGRDASFSRSVPSSVFANAPRYHNGGVAGLAPNEVPAILQQGEVVLPRGASMGGSNTYYIDARGADMAAIARLEKSLLTLAGPGVVEKRAVAANIDAARRGRTRGL